MHNSNLIKKRERDPETGQYLPQCACINHHEWSFDHLYKEIDAKTTKKFGKDIVKRMQKMEYYLSFQKYYVRIATQPIWTDADLPCEIIYLHSLVKVLCHFT